MSDRNEKAVLQVLLGEFYDKLGRLEGIVPRDATFPDAPQKIRVAIGMRRTGKTYFVYQTILRLIGEGISRKQILYVNFEDDRLLPLDAEKLGQLVEAFYALYPENHEKKCYLFFDEVQNVENWPLVIRRLHDSKKVEIFLTGSSARLLSKEIASSLRGRSLAVEIWPYQFKEFLRAKRVTTASEIYDKKTEDQLKALFQEYLSTGGFPEVTSFSRDIRQQTLQEYLDVAIYRDIIERHNVKHPTLIKYMILSMLHNAGRPFAVNKFYKDIHSQGYRVSKDILYEYVEHIEDAYLAFLVPLYDPSIRKVQTNPKKLYAIDCGMVRALTLEYELERFFKNIIYLDLRRLGCDVYYYLTKERYEIDFLIVTAQGHKKMFQVIWDQIKEHALQAAMKELNIEGEIVTLDSYLREGINI